MLRLIFKALLLFASILGSSLVNAEEVLISGLILATIYLGTVQIVLDHGRSEAESARR